MCVCVCVCTRSPAWPSLHCMHLGRVAVEVGKKGEQEAADRDLGCVIGERELTMIKLIGIE